MVGSGPGNIRKKQVLFVHCGGSQGLHEGSYDLVAWLRMALGSSYDVLYPPMPQPDQPGYEQWRSAVHKQIADLDDGLILIGHSLGGSVLLKYLSEQPIAQKIAGLFMIGSPYWGKRNWRVQEYILKEDFTTCLPNIPYIFLYHSRQDSVVPFKHLSYYGEKLPLANLRPVRGREHLFSTGLPDLAYDIRSLNARDN